MSGIRLPALGCAVWLWMCCLPAREAWAGPELFLADDAFFIIWVIDPATGAATRALPLPAAAPGNGVPPARSGLAHGAGELFYTHSAAGRIWVLSPDSGALLRVLDKPEPGLSGLGFTSGDLFAVGEDALYRLDARSGAVLERRRVPAAREALDASPSRGSLFLRVGGLELREIDAQSGATLSSLAPPAPVSGLAWSDDLGALFAAADGAIHRLDPATGAVIATFPVADRSGLPLLRPGGLAARDDGGEGDAGGVPDPDTELDVQDRMLVPGESGDTLVLLSSAVELEGFQVAIAHDPAVLGLEDISIEGTDTQFFQADFTAVELLPAGGTLGVVFDLIAPFEGNVLPPGQDRVVARFRYFCAALDLAGPTETEVRFVDGVLGTPPKDNIAVIGGLAVTPVLQPGRITCLTRPPTPGGPEYFCGGALGPGGLPRNPEARSGDRTRLCFYYQYAAPPDPQIQGLSMALAFDCRLRCLEETFDVPPESITSIVQADFVDFQCDNDPADGDGCEMVLGILVDADPPFDRAQLPATPVPLLLACVQLEVGGGVERGECLDVRFRDGVNGNGRVPIKNVVAVKNQSVSALTHACAVCVTATGPSLYCGGSVLDASGRPAVAVGDPGGSVDLCLWYSSPDGPVEALTQALRFDCRMACDEGSFRVAADLPELARAEFVSFQCENDPADGDPCEAVLQIVAFNDSTGLGTRLPATNQPRRLGCFSVRIDPQARPGTCLAVEHFDGASGEPGQPFENAVELATGAVAPQLFDCQVCVAPEDVPKFLCGGPELGPDGLPSRFEEIPRGEQVELCFWYVSPEDELGTADEIEGLSMAIEHDCNLRCLESTFHVPPDSALAEARAEFVSFHCESNPRDGDGCEMVLGVLVDAQPPFDGRRLPPTETPRKLACVFVEVLPTAKPGFCLPVRFRDGVNGRGTVPIKNLVSVNKFSVSPRTCDCEVCVKHLGPKFLCGSGELGPDLKPGIPLGRAGQPVELCLWYCSPEDGSSAHAQFDQIQGVSMALEYDCRLECIESSVRLPPDSISAALGVEYVQLQCDNDPADGDGCELVLGLLVDATPPFDGRTLPPTAVPLKLACVDFRLPADAACAECFDVRFKDGVNGRGKVPIFNQVAVENQSFLALTFDCQICTSETIESEFLRGDCNFQGGVDIADAAEVVSFLFAAGTWKPLPPCLDACDAQDDGRLDLADAHAILQYLFRFGRPPPAPGPIEPGPDPTADKLGCRVNPCP